MPKGIVKCGNCEQWDLFRDGNKGLEYSLSVVSDKVSTLQMIEGFYYAQAPNERAYWVDSNWEARVAGIIHKYTSNGLKNIAGAMSGGSGPWYQITIDENSGTSVPK